MPSNPFTGHIPRPSQILLRSRNLTIGTVVAAVVLSIVAAGQPDWLLRADRPLADAFRGDALHGFFGFWTQLGSQQDMALVAAASGLLLWRRCRPFAVALPAALLAGVVLDVGLKLLVDRPRPPEPLVGTALGSFPSGHAITGLVLFGLLPPAVLVALRRRSLFWASVPVAFAAGLLVALSRVYLGAHWPSDVVASLFISAAVLVGTELALGTGQARRWCDGCALHHTGNA